MSRKTFVSFGLLLVVLAVGIPWLAFQADGEQEATAGIPARLDQAKGLFRTNCGACHMLAAAGTNGNFGPDLDELLAPAGLPEGPEAEQTIEATEKRVLNAIENGVDSTSEAGRMPPGILAGEQAEEVAEFVARTAGEG